MRKLVLIVLLFILQFPLVISQVNDSRNGYHHAPYGKLRALLIFAEVINDPFTLGPIGNWPAGDIPPFANDFFDHELPGDQIPEGYLTKYFHEASFGSFTFLGDYFPELITISFDTLQGMGELQVINYLNSLEGNDLYTAHGYSVNSGDFDKWTLSNARGGRNLNGPDGRIDMLVIIWRTNSRINVRSGGYILTSSWDFPLKDKKGFNDYTSMVSDWHVMSLLRHEFAHSLLGGNNFHSGGAGAGSGMFLSDVGGYSLISTWNRNHDFVNGWDRYHLGWKNPDHQFEISARDIHNNEVESDLVYGNPMPEENGIFVLRDFAAHGDVIRIDLPWIKSGNSNARQQWLWIENHQFPGKMVHHKACTGRGIYLNVQVGNNDRRTGMNSRTNYIFPVHPFGNYDWEYLKREQVEREYDFLLAESIPHTDKADEFIISTAVDLANPFTGYHFHMQHAVNYLNPDEGKIFNKEVVNPSGVIFNDSLLDESYFCYKTYPIFGSLYDAYLPGMKIGISENPATVPLMTYHTRNRMGSAPPYPEPAGDDNRNIYLNGLSIEVLEQRNNGDMVIKLRWDDFDVDKDVRWCGPIVLNERVHLKTGSSLILDQGLTPVRPVNPIDFEGQMVFADTTSLTCNEGSFIQLERGSTLEIKNNSALILEPASVVEINRGSRIIIHSGSSMVIKKGAELSVRNNGMLEVLKGGNLYIEEGANIRLVNLRSRIVYR